jgi:transcriptional regulator GlxA family with amidase domain
VARVKKVAVVVQDGAEPFGLGAMCEVWAEPYHVEDDNPVFDFVVATPRPGRVRGASGYDLHVEHGLDAAADADLVCVTPKRAFREPSPEVVELIRDAHDRGAHVFAHCTAAFVLGEAGLLDGRRATTHWRHVDELRDAYPEALVDGNVLYVQDGTIVTGAGSAAGLDAALHLMRQQFGAKTAADAARRMVVPPHRDGGQAQYIARAVPDCDAETLGPLLTWIIENLSDDLGVDALARRNHMSPRTFARRFRDETGTTPHAWVTRQRLQAAEELLERTDHSVDWIATEVGFGNGAALRHHFSRARGVSPQQYRRTFSGMQSA